MCVFDVHANVFKTQPDNGMTPNLCAGMAGLRSARPSMLHWASAIHLDPSYNSGEDTTCSQFGSAQGVEHLKQWSYMEYHGHACVKISEHKNSNGSRGLGDLKANTELSRHRGKVTDMAAPNETQPPITAGSQLTRWSIYPPAKLKESERTTSTSNLCWKYFEVIFHFF